MDEKVYLEKLSAFTRMLRLQGLAVSPQETADGAKLLIALGLEDREQVKTALRTVFASTREEQLTFDRVFDGFFLSEEAMRAQAKEQMEREKEQLQRRMEAEQDLDRFGDTLKLDREQRDGLVREAVLSMGQPDREIFLRFYYYCQSVSVISEKMQMNPSTVKTRLHRGREKLRQHLTGFESVKGGD